MAAMHCPGCGVKAELTQKFCRSCGLSLEKIPQLFAEQHSSPEILYETDKLAKRKQKIDQSLAVAGFGFGALLAVSLLTGLIYLVVAGHMPLIPGIILLILSVAGVVAGSLAMYSEKLKKTLTSTDSAGAMALPDSQPLIETHEPQFVSITERTTNLLETNLSQEKNSETEQSS